MERTTLIRLCALLSVREGVCTADEVLNSRQLVVNCRRLFDDRVVIDDLQLVVLEIARQRFHGLDTLLARRTVGILRSRPATRSKLLANAAVDDAMIRWNPMSNSCLERP